MSKTEIPFIGGAYTQRSPVTNTQQSINCFPVVDKQETTRVVSLQGTPGLVEYARLEGFGPPSDVNVVIRGTFTNIVPDCTITASVEDDGFEAQRLADLDLFTSMELELAVLPSEEYSSPYDLDDTWSANRDKTSYYADKSLFPTKAGRDGDIIPGGEEGKFYVDENTGNIYVWDKVMPYNAPRSLFAFSDNAYKGNYAQCVPTFTFDEEITLTFDMGEGNKCDANYVALMGRGHQHHRYLPTFREVVVRGSNDGVSWRTLRTAAAHNSLPLGNYVGGEIGFYLRGVFISVPNPVSYRYFQLGFLSTYSHINDNAIWLSSVAIGKTDTVLTSNLRCNNLVVGGEISSEAPSYAEGVFDGELYGLAVAPNKDVYAFVYQVGLYKQSGGVGSFSLVSDTYKNWRQIFIASNGDMYGSYEVMYRRASGSSEFVIMEEVARQWNQLTEAPNGDIYAAVGGWSRDIYKQAAGTVGFVPLEQESHYWTRIVAAPNGDIYAIAAYVGDVFDHGEIYRQANGTSGFVAVPQTVNHWVDITVAPNGDVYAIAYWGDNKGIYKQSAGTVGFVMLEAGSKTYSYFHIAATSNGDIFVTVPSYDGGIYRQYQGEGPFELLPIFPDGFAPYVNKIVPAPDGGAYITRDGYDAVDVYGTVYKIPASYSFAPSYPHLAFLDTCGFTISVSDTLINNSDILDTVSGGEGGSAGLGGTVPALAGANGMNGVAGGAGKNPIKSGGGKGGDGGAGGAAGGDVKVVPSNRTKNLDHAWGGLGGYGGFGGKGGGRIVIFAKTFINYGYIGAFGMPGTGGYNGFTGDRVISSGIVVIPDFASCYQTYIHGGPGGGGNAGKGGDGGSVRIFYVNLEESGYVEAFGGFESYQPGSAGFTKSVPGGPGGLAVIPTPTVGEGGLGVDGSGDGGKGFGAKTTNQSGGTTGDASGGAYGAEGKEGIVVWTHLDYPEEIDSTEIRGMIRAGENIYVVMGSYVFKIDKDGIPAVIGSIFSSTGDVDMAYNGSQILIVDGTPMGSFVDQDDTVNLIFGTGFPEATSCCFMDGYFVVTSTDHDDLGREIPGRIHLSNSYDASEWDELDWATAEGHPDRVLCCRQHSNNLWFFGEQSTEVWYNSGNPDMPFVRIQGALLDDGTAAWKSIVLISDNFYWLTDKREVVMNVGYQRRKISTIHIDYLIQEMEHVSDAKGFEYRADGHTFYVLTFPTEDITLVYDLTTTFWHVWSSYKEDVEEPELPYYPK